MGFEGKFNEALYERGKIIGWLMKQKSYWSGMEELEISPALQKELEREEEETRTMLPTLLECWDVENFRRHIMGKLIC